MKIKEVHVSDFRRFSDLTIKSIPPTAKLIVLLGQNGSGKSSVFDAFSLYSTNIKHNAYLNYDEKYFSKTSSKVQGRAENRISIQFHDCSNLNRNDDGRRSFYFRSAYRFEEGFHIEGVRRQASVLADNEDPRWMVAQDKRVSANYQSMVSFLIEELSEPGNNNNISRTELRDKYISSIQTSMSNIFPDLNLESFGRPLQDGTFLFTKGISHNFPYKNLSGGEKAAFDLLLDFVIKTKDFNNTVFCVDEPELHMHSALAGSLLAELYKLIPDNCQLWIATHSLGMIRMAKELFEKYTGAVVFLDFSNRDFDKAQIIEPIIPNRTFWKNAFSITLDDMVSLIAPKRVFLCEGHRKETEDQHNHDFDARCYNKIFAQEFPDVQFVSAGGCYEVEKNSILVGSIFQECVPGVMINTIYDRDDRSEADVEDIRKNGGVVLSRRDIENYLWDDEVLTKLCKEEEKAGMALIIISKKKELLDKITPPNDVKKIAGSLFNEIKTALRLYQRGNTHEAFARDTLTPLITPDMDVYKQLRKDIFGF